MCWFVFVVVSISVLFFFLYFMWRLCWKLWWKTRTFGSKLGGIRRQCGFIRKQCNNIFCGVAFSEHVRATMLSNFRNPFSYFQVRAYWRWSFLWFDVDVDIDTKQMIDSDKKWYLWDTQVAQRSFFIRINSILHKYFSCSTTYTFYTYILAGKLSDIKTPNEEMCTNNI